jgi:hypothetical protein
MSFRLCSTGLAAALLAAPAAFAQAPSVALTATPPACPGGAQVMNPVAGMVSQAPKDAVAVVFALADGLYWVQPYEAAYRTPLSATGTFATRTHCGSTYLVVIAKPSYRFSTNPTTDTPRAGEDVYAVGVFPGR